MTTFSIARFLDGQDPASAAARWWRLARRYQREAQTFTLRTEREDAEQAAARCRSIAAACWEFASQQQQQPAPPRRHLYPRGRFGLAG